MAEKENKIAEENPISNLKSSSITCMLQHWSNSIGDYLETEKSYSESADTFSNVIHFAQCSNLSEKLQHQILEEMMGMNGGRDSEQFIRMIQILATRLLDNVSTAIINNPSLTENEPLQSFIQAIVTLLQFIQDFFWNYFDRNEKLPDILINIYRSEISSLEKEFMHRISLSPDINPALTSLLNKHFTEELWVEHKQTGYKHFFYEKELLTQLLKEKSQTEIAIRHRLHYFNFNSSSFVIYEFDRLTKLITQLSSKADKINMLRTELKTINQLPARVNYCYDEEMPSLKEQVSTWIEEEIRYCETGHFTQLVNASGTDNENKIHTTLSVAKLSLLIRLLVIDKIIINRTIAPMLRTVAKTFTTLQREEVSFGSLETKYHAPDKATIAVMKEILQKWIIILGKL